MGNLSTEYLVLHALIILYMVGLYGFGRVSSSRSKASFFVEEMSCTL